MKVLKCILTAIGLIIPGSTAIFINNTSILTTNVPVNHPEMYKNFPLLWHLDMSNQTSFEFPLDRVLLVHTKLARYFCNNCSVHSIYMQSFSMLPQLTHLELDHNNLSYIHPDAFENNPLLHKVQLVGNNLVKFNPLATLNHVTFLSILNLNQNPGFNINQVQMKLPWLVYFSCKYCNTSFVDKSTMSRWKRLGHLHLPNNNIERIDQDAFQPMSRFKHLNIKGNQKMTKLNVQSKTLQHLDAEGCGLEGMLDTSDLPALETINVRNNKILKIHERGFQNCENIKRILLDDNQIDKIPDKLLELSLYKLEALCVDRNPLQPREILDGFRAKYSAKKLRRACLDDESPSKQLENLPSINGVALYTNFSDVHKFEENSTADFSFQNIVSSTRALQDSYSIAVWTASAWVQSQTVPVAFFETRFVRPRLPSDGEVNVGPGLTLRPSMNEKLFLYSVISCILVINIMDVNCYKLGFDVHSLLSKYADQPDLWQLDISNQTSFELPKDRVLMYHKKLARFYCNNCSVHSIYKLSFSMIPQLTHLELDNNNLSHIHKDAFENNKLLQKKNTKIENLDLSENDLKFIVPNLFEELRSFRTLNLQKNRLLTTAPGNIFLEPSTPLFEPTTFGLRVQPPPAIPPE
ncbi:toll-like receptor [Culex quinquefasciatus]|uniref:Toll-like receptor n=1 Tax=Culex quinquefasciatus TaxID=7176 RepID=B0VZK1_CULQU|nr:toll-like receptor [Culex quinquefasciatus]|eukprot:XP_001841885.1 toll-like receptor [Culex quinquefasciatus]